MGTGAIVTSGARGCASHMDFLVEFELTDSEETLAEVIDGRDRAGTVATADLSVVARDAAGVTDETYLVP
jgi:hypothetical protein